MTSLTRRAVLIQPSYAKLPEKHWLPGTSKDITNVKNILLNKFAFEERNITILQDDNAKKDHILNVLNDLECDLGDIVFIYYAGHGVYLEDSQDEGLLPTITSWPVERPQEEKCITGQDLLPCLNRLSKKMARVTMIFDCCHSGQLYRVLEFNEIDLKPRQVVLSRGPGDQPSKPTTRTKKKRGGWAPDDKDRFFYFAACTTVQVAGECYDGGLLTIAMVKVLNDLESPGSISYESFFRLIKREFKLRGWDTKQTPQFEAANSRTVLYGASIVTPPEEAIEIKDILNKDEVLLNAGFLQSLRPGKYEVFETTTTADSVKAGQQSKDWLGTIDVNEGHIETTQALGFIVDTKKDHQINVGCLAFLHTPDSIKHCVFVNAQESSKLVESLKATKMLNVLSQPPSTPDPDLITITCEDIKGKPYWVARQRDRVILPPIGAVEGRQNMMASNLSRHLRYHISLSRTQTPSNEEDLLNNISLKVFKFEKVRAYSKFSRNTRALEGIENGIHITEVGVVRPTFKAHSENNRRLVEGSGDAFVFQISNNNEFNKDTLHICIMLYQFDGAIKAVYPLKKGDTVELRGGDTSEDIFRVYIPKHSLRVMSEPDLSTDEPNMGINKLVLYASSQAVDYGPLLQSCIETDPDLMPRGEISTPLGDLDKFLALNQRCVPDGETQEDIKYLIEKVDIVVLK